MDTPEPLRISDHLPFKKAGMVLAGDIQGVAHVIAPYTEGRFGHNRKYYVLASGSVDAGEDVLEAGIREASEETGIDIHRLLGEDAIAALHRGETVEDRDSGYAGVRIKRVVPNALDYTYLSREDRHNHMALFKIELEGIENLRPFLKNQRNASRQLGMPEEVTFPVRTDIAANPSKLSSFEDHLEWLRSMRMPTRPWAGQAKEEVLTPVGEAVGKDRWFANLEADYLRMRGGAAGDKITTPDVWQDFLQHLNEAEYETIRSFAETIKARLKTLGVHGKDHDIYKLDSSDCPLAVCQEGADLLRADKYLEAVIHGGLSRRDYAQAFCGNTPQMEWGTPPKGRAERIEHSQLAGVVWAVGEPAIDTVADRYRTKQAATRQDNSWLGGDMYDDSLRSDLHQVAAAMRAREKPIATILQADYKGRITPVQAPERVAS